LPATLHSPRVELPVTEIYVGNSPTQAQRLTDVVPFEFSWMFLVVNFRVDPALYAAGNYYFRLNFQVKEVATGGLNNNMLFGPLSYLQGWNGVAMVKQASTFGVRYSPHGGDEHGLYLFRPYISMNRYVSWPYRAVCDDPATAEYAVADEHYFMLECQMPWIP
jgi:hypothetical protein